MTILDSFIQERFAQAGYDLEVETKGRYYAGMWRLLGGQAYLLRSEPILRLLSNAQLRKGRAFTYRELLGFAQPGRKAAVEAFNRRLMALEARQILLRGYNVQCATCDLLAWYEPGQIGSGVCQGCRSSLALPLELAGLRLPPEPVVHGRTEAGRAHRAADPGAYSTGCMVGGPDRQQRRPEN